MRLSIHCITLPVDDLAKAAAFYRDGLGLEVSEEGGDEDHVSFELDDGFYLVLLARAEFTDFAGGGGAQAASRGASSCILSHFAESKDEVDSLLAKAGAAGAKVTPADAEEWGYTGYFTDPDGHVWEVLYSE